MDCHNSPGPRVDPVACQLAARESTRGFIASDVLLLHACVRYCCFSNGTLRSLHFKVKWLGVPSYAKRNPRPPSEGLRRAPPTRTRAARGSFVPVLVALQEVDHCRAAGGRPPSHRHGWLWPSMRVGHRPPRAARWRHGKVVVVALVVTRQPALLGFGLGRRRLWGRRLALCRCRLGRSWGR